MGNYGNHNRNVLGTHGAFPEDEWDKYQDRQRLGKADFVAPGKTLRPKHNKAPSRDFSIDEIIETLLESLNDSLFNKVDIHYRLGCAYRTKGDWARAKEHFEIAARKGHSEAQKELD